MIPEITPTALKQRLESGDTTITIIDVRQPWEVDICRIPNSLNIPMDDIPDSLDQLPREGTIVFVCHSGQRSAAVTNWLRMQGYTNVLNMAGGIDRWAREVDPSMRRY